MFLAIVFLVVVAVLLIAAAHNSRRRDEGMEVPTVIPLSDHPADRDMTRVPANEAYALCTALTFQTGRAHVANQNPDGTYSIVELKGE